jgi:hypothetical protein
MTRMKQKSLTKYFLNVKSKHENTTLCSHTIYKPNKYNLFLQMQPPYS